jgi:4-hydroxy-tetrahydrodipicolinate reductase
MLVGLLGFGKMGQAVAQVLGKSFQGHAVETIIIDPHAAEAQFSSLQECLADTSHKVDVLIDFTHPQAVLENIRLAAQAQVPLVVGTTGWKEAEQEVCGLVEQNNSTLVYASNFSIGVALYLRVITEAARLFAGFEQYDVGGYEIHHRAKVDSPSGTAHSIVETLLAQSPSKSKASFEAQHSKRDDDVLHFASLRVGEVSGTHCVRFESDCDSVVLTHEARNRNGFAQGAALAAVWILEVQGMWNFQDLLAHKLDMKSSNR